MSKYANSLIAFPLEVKSEEQVLGASHQELKREIFSVQKTDTADSRGRTMRGVAFS